MADRTSARMIRAREREKKALELRKAGATYAQIAEKLGYSDPKSAWHAVMRALDRLPREDAEKVRRLELSRLDTIALRLWRKIVEEGDIQAVNAYLRVMERRARYLGLDAPEKKALTDPSGKKPLRLVDLFPPEIVSKITQGSEKISGSSAAEAER